MENHHETMGFDPDNWWWDVAHGLRNNPGPTPNEIVRDINAVPIYSKLTCWSP